MTTHNQQQLQHFCCKLLWENFKKVCAAGWIQKVYTHLCTHLKSADELKTVTFLIQMFAETDMVQLFALRGQHTLFLAVCYCRANQERHWGNRSTWWTWGRVCTRAKTGWDWPRINFHHLCCSWCLVRWFEGGVNHVVIEQRMSWNRTWWNVCVCVWEPRELFQCRNLPLQMVPLPT